MSKRKEFDRDQRVEVQREPGATWERATYSHRVGDNMPGWHCVEMPAGRGRWVDPMTGVSTFGEVTDEQRAHGYYYTSRMLVPTQRVRALPTWSGGHCRQVAD